MHLRRRALGRAALFLPLLALAIALRPALGAPVAGEADSAARFARLTDAFFAREFPAVTDDPRADEIRDLRDFDRRLHADFDPAALDDEAWIDFKIIENRVHSGLFQPEAFQRGARDPLYPIPRPGRWDAVLAGVGSGPFFEGPGGRSRACLDALERWAGEAADILNAARGSIRHGAKESLTEAARLAGAFQRTLRARSDALRAQVEPWPASLQTRLDRLDQALESYRDHLRSLAAAPKPLPELTSDERRTRCAHRLRYNLVTDLSPEELFELGQAQFRKIRGDLESLAEEIHPGTDWRTVAEELKQNHPAAEDLLDAGKKNVAAAIEFVDEHRLVTIPDFARNVAVKWGNSQAKTPYGFYMPGWGNSKGPRGTYVVVPISKKLPAAERRSRLEDNNHYWLKVVALHEAIPGHHLQFAVASQIKNRVRRLSYHVPYIEGWGLYCEGMMDRAGYFADPRERFTLLKMRLWRCARVVIDVGLQMGTLSQAEGVGLLTDGVGLAEGPAKDEVARYADQPSYYSGYLLGFLAFQDMRKAAEEKAGDRFDLCAFHDRILSCGPVPQAWLRPVILGERGTKTAPAPAEAAEDAPH